MGGSGTVAEERGTSAADWESAPLGIRPSGHTQLLFPVVPVCSAFQRVMSLYAPSHGAGVSAVMINFRPNDAGWLACVRSACVSPSPCAPPRRVPAGHPR